MNKNLIIIYLVFLLLVLEVIGVGVVEPVPNILELKGGEIGQFRFKIYAGNDPIKCVYDTEKGSVLELKFENDETIIDAQSGEFVVGTVKVPKDLSNGKYTTTFCVLCSGLNKEEGASSINIEFCNLPLAVDVVDVRTRENMFKEEKPVQKVNLLPIVLIIVVIIIIGYLYATQKKEKKKRK